MSHRKYLECMMQAAYRTWVERRTLLLRRRYAIIVQKFFRMTRAKKLYSIRVEKASIIARCCRCWLDRLRRDSHHLADSASAVKGRTLMTGTSDGQLHSALDPSPIDGTSYCPNKCSEKDGHTSANSFRPSPPCELSLRPRGQVNNKDSFNSSSNGVHLSR